MRFYDVTSWRYVNLDDPVAIVARGVLHPIVSCPCVHLLSQMTSDFHERDSTKSKVDRTAGLGGATSLEGQLSSA